VRKILFILFATVIICNSCSKEHSTNPAKNLFKVSIKPAVNAIDSAWQQVLGGEALISFIPDTVNVSPIKDSLNLKSIASYNRQVLAGTYNISLSTESTAVADTFIRFNAQLNNFLINKDQAISFPATTNDGVITINKSLIAALTVPTFIPAGTNTVYNFGLANGCYFIYVTGASTGRITFAEVTSGYIYMNDLTITAMNQYDLSPILNTSGAVVHLHPFHLQAILK
jgi:hypothetical protein